MTKAEEIAKKIKLVYDMLNQLIWNKPVLVAVTDCAILKVII